MKNNDVFPAFDDSDHPSFIFITVLFLLENITSRRNVHTLSIYCINFNTKLKVIFIRKLFGKLKLPPIKMFLLFQML